MRNVTLQSPSSFFGNGAATLHQKRPKSEDQFWPHDAGKYLCVRPKGLSLRKWRKKGRKITRVDFFPREQAVILGTKSSKISDDELVLPLCKFNWGCCMPQRGSAPLLPCTLQPPEMTSELHGKHRVLKWTFDWKLYLITIQMIFIKGSQTDWWW